MGTGREEAERAVKAQAAICAEREKRFDEAIVEMRLLGGKVSAFMSEVQEDRSTTQEMLKRHDGSLYGSGAGADDIGLAGEVIKLKQSYQQQKWTRRTAASAMITLAVLTAAGWLTALGIWVFKGGAP